MFLTNHHSFSVSGYSILKKKIFIAQFRLHSSSIESGFRYRVKGGKIHMKTVCTYKIVLYRVFLTFI